jgi:DNA-binding response OmpR family regulator
MPAKVVIIEDEPDINEAFEYSLTREGYKVWSETDGRRGLDLVRQKTPDLLVLDLMLPSLDGTEICRQIKSDPVLKGTCIIMVTAKTEETDILVGLGLGADDYVTKPFKTRELLARVQAVLRRGKLREEESTEIIRFEEIVIDTLRHEVSVGGSPVQLTATEFRLLRFLAGNPGRVFTRNQLLNHVIGDNAIVIDRNIDVHIRSIRRKLPSSRELIDTIRGVGYRFAARA